MRRTHRSTWPDLAASGVIALLCAAASTAPASSICAQVALRVQARSLLTAQATFGSEGLLVGGTLTDDLGAPLDTRALEVRAGSAASRATTDARGRFEVLLAAVTQRTTLTITFAGDSLQLATQLERDVDPARTPVSLAFELSSPRIDLDLAVNDVAVQASSRADAAGLEVSLRDERDVVMAKGTTDARGRVAWHLSSRLLGAPGSGRWTASTPADAAREAAHTQLEVVRAAGTRLAVSASQASARSVRVEGRLFTRQSPLPDRAVSLYVDDRPVADVQTDAQGAFASQLEVERWPVTIHAIYLPEVDWLGAARSTPVPIGEQPLPTPSLLWLLLPLVCCVPAMRALWKRRAAPVAQERVSSSGSRVSKAPQATGRARGPSSTRIGGRVLDDSSDRGLPQARVHVRLEDSTILEATLDQSGQFELGPLPHGPATLIVRAPGFVDIEHTLRIPHHGEASMLEVRLSSTRTRVLTLFYEAAGQVLPAGFALHRMTPREVVSAARRPPSHDDALGQLADRVQRAAYGRAVPAQDEIAEVQEAAQRWIGTPHSRPGGPKHRR